MVDKKLLYKYRSIQGESRYYTSRLITHGLAYYASPKQFNDPLDCRFVVDLRGEQRPLSLVQSHFGEPWRQEQERFREIVDAKLSIFSLSEIRDSTLMWSHYSDGHRGVCVGIELEVDSHLGCTTYDAKPATVFAADLFAIHLRTKTACTTASIRFSLLRRNVGP
jgi:hypothetical protein